MKRVLLLTLGLFVFLAGTAFSQTLFDFEGDAQGWYDNGWAGGLTSVMQAADPTGNSAGVLSVGYDIGVDKKGVLEFPSLDASSGKLITYHVWLPADFPDGVDFELWIQDNASWGWSDVGYTIFKSQDIPKETWFPLSTDIVSLSLRASNVDLMNNKIGKGGIQIGAWGIADADTSWSGTFYLDDVELIGAAPNYFAQFETDASGWFDNGWAGGLTGVAQAADPTGESSGVLSVGYNIGADQKGVLEYPSLDATTANVISYNVWLPADFPDGVDFELWIQDNASWGWSDAGYTIYKSENIPREVWFPLTTDIVALSLKATNVDLINNKIGKAGIQLGAWNVSGDGATWNGTFYIDNCALLNSDLGNNWNVANFENVAAGLQGFSLATWGPAGISIERMVDPTGQSEGVLQLNHDYNAGVKSFFSKEGILLSSQDTGTHVTEITMDAYIPTDFPEGSVFEIVFNGAATIPEWTWTPTPYDTSNLVWGAWNTLSIDVQALIDSGLVDPAKTATVGVQIFHNDAQTWSGALYFDNLILHGIPAPEGELASPPLVVSAATTSVPGGSGTVHYVRLDWVDNTLGTEKYNIYMSNSPFTSIDEEGVILYAAGIPHGLQSYAHRPYTSDGSEQTYYYAITATDGIEETAITQDASGSITTVTTPTYKIKYVKDFSTKFVLDGLNTEFLEYVEDFQITPESGSYANGDDWAPGGSDLDFKVTMIMDDEYLYFSGDVTDDDLRDVEGGFQAWQGDALELYMGFYNVNDTSKWHQKRSIRGDGGDWRVGFTSMGDVQLDGYESAVVPGLESVVFAKFTGDGYIVEAKFNLDSLAGTDLQVTNGMLMPFKIDNTDQDPNLMGDEERTLITGVGAIPREPDTNIDMDQDWMRPHAWGFLEVVDGPGTAVNDEISKLPTVFNLSNNYPNPFNPTTTIQYDIPKKSFVQLKVYNILGREVATLVNANKIPGYYKVNFDASHLANGVYIFKLIAGDYISTKKMTLLK
ncbi:MAG: T9SS type A sorting domain-containing protein [Deferribacteres bacterium]|nr:T9SS type A sorting domain-containing protein [candidate division KSB1 bacterium]MCB9502169.1 T9SS type A sorting domain-containing protein [Deferribacteres bacterium]